MHHPDPLPRRTHRVDHVPDPLGVVELQPGRVLRVLYDVKESLFLVPEPGMFSYGFITPATAQKLWDPSWEDAGSNSILVSGDDSSETVDKLWDCLDEQGLRITTRQTDSHISAAYDSVAGSRNG